MISGNGMFIVFFHENLYSLSKNVQVLSLCAVGLAETVPNQFNVKFIQLTKLGHILLILLVITIYHLHILGCGKSQLTLTNCFQELHET